MHMLKDKFKYKDSDCLKISKRILRTNALNIKMSICAPVMDFFFLVKS